MLPLLGFVGAAIDYSRAAHARSAMQAALDSTSLMLSKDLSTGTITQSQISTKAVSYFTALYTNKDAQGVSINATYTPGSGTTGNTVQVNGSGSIVTDFMRIAGFPTMGYNATSTSTWGTSLLRVALVLDTTGSMADYNKIGNLQTAAKNLVTQLSNLVVNPGDVYISVVPFEIDVNVGTTNVGASWLRWDLWDPSNYSNASQPYNTYCDQGYWNTKAQCLGHGYNWNHSTGSPSHSQWNGCVTDRDQSYDVSSTVPSSTTTNFPADQDQSCPAAQVTPLTYQLDHRQQHHQRDVTGRRDQPDHRPAVGLALAVATVAAECTGRRFDQAIPARHHPLHRRLEHRRPLVRRLFQHQHAGRLAHERAVHQHQEHRRARFTRCRSIPTAPASRRCCRPAPATRTTSSC